MPRTCTATPGPLCSIRTGPSARSCRASRRVIVPAVWAAAWDHRCSAERPGDRRSAPWRPASQMPRTPTNRSSSCSGRPETIPTSVSARATSRARSRRRPAGIRTASGVRAIGTSVPSKSKMATSPRRRRVSSSSTQSRRSIKRAHRRRQTILPGRVTLTRPRYRKHDVAGGIPRAQAHGGAMVGDRDVLGRRGRRTAWWVVLSRGVLQTLVGTPSRARVRSLSQVRLVAAGLIPPSVVLAPAVATWPLACRAGRGA